MNYREISIYKFFCFSSEEDSFGLGFDLFHFHEKLILNLRYRMFSSDLANIPNIHDVQKHEDYIV